MGIVLNVSCSSGASFKIAKKVGNDHSNSGISLNVAGLSPGCTCFTFRANATAHAMDNKRGEECTGLSCFNQTSCSCTNGCFTRFALHTSTTSLSVLPLRGH